MTRLFVFDDGGGMLGPLTDLRPAMLTRTGALTTLERLTRAAADDLGAQLSGVFVPEPLAEVTRERLEVPVNEPASLGAGEVLLLNGRCILPPEELLELKSRGALVTGRGTVAAARVSAGDASSIARGGPLPSGMAARTIEAAMLEFPWDVIRYRDEALDYDLALLCAGEAQPLPDGVIGINDESIWLDPEATIYPGVILDAEQGPIHIAADAVVRPGAIIIGPTSIGRGSQVLDRALIKAHTVIGPVCKAAGEVGGTIFQGFANKAHDGHLGDSYVGEWVNFGAGTTNSNLLNTYGEVIAAAAPGAPRERTGLRHLGCIVGDHVKFAICSRIMTGSVFGTGCMFAATAPPPAVTGRFEWHTDRGVQAYRLSKCAEVARTVMARRKLELSAAYLARLEALSPGA